LAFAVALPQSARVHAIRVREVQAGKVIADCRLHLAQSRCFGYALYAIEHFRAKSLSFEILGGHDGRLLLSFHPILITE